MRKIIFTITISLVSLIIITFGLFYNFFKLKTYSQSTYQHSSNSKGEKINLQQSLEKKISLNPLQEVKENTKFENPTLDINKKSTQNELVFNKLEFDKIYNSYIISEAFKEETEIDYCDHMRDQTSVIKSSKDAFTALKNMQVDPGEKTKKLSLNLISGPVLEVMKLPKVNRFLKSIYSDDLKKKNSFSNITELVWLAINAVRDLSNSKEKVFKKSEDFRVMYSLYRLAEQHPHLISNSNVKEACLLVQNQLTKRNSDLSNESDDANENYFGFKDFLNLMKELNIDPIELGINESEERDQIHSGFDPNKGNLVLSISSPWSEKNLK